MHVILEYFCEKRQKILFVKCVLMFFVGAITKYNARKKYTVDSFIKTYIYLSISVFGNVVLFVYTDSCNISVENVSDLLNTGDMFLLPGRLIMKLDLL